MSQYELRVVPNEPPAFVGTSDDDAASVEGFKPLLPEGLTLEARYLGHETAMVFNTGKIFLRFEVVEPGEYKGVRLFRAFRVRRLTSRPGPNGKFVVANGGELYRLLVRLQDIRLRADRISLAPLRHMLLRVTTRTVTMNHQQKDHPEQSRYSVIDTIERGE